jgi:hypothetical protein
MSGTSPTDLTDLLRPRPLTPADWTLDPHWKWWKVPEDWFNILPVPPVDVLDPDGSRGAHTVGLTDSDRRTLRGALSALKSARADLKSSDAVLRSRGRAHLVTVIGYLSGFFEGKGLGAANSGLTGMAPTTTDDDLGGMLDQLEKLLEEIAFSPRSRSIVLGLTFIALGITAKAVAKALPE